MGAYTPDEWDNITARAQERARLHFERIARLERNRRQSWKRRRDDTGSCPAELRGRVRAAFDYTCQYCGFTCRPGESKRIRKNTFVGSDWMTVDRILPGCKGGKYTPDNVTLACRRCNSKRARGKIAPDHIVLTLAMMEVRNA